MRQTSRAKEANQKFVLCMSRDPSSALQSVPSWTRMPRTIHGSFHDQKISKEIFVNLINVNILDIYWYSVFCHNMVCCNDTYSHALKGRCLVPRLDLWLWFWLCWLYLGIILVNLREIIYIYLYYDGIFGYYVYLILFCYFICWYFGYFLIINRYLILNIIWII